MASILNNDSKHLLEEYPFVSRKRFKISELPLNSAQRSTIEGLLHTIKKKGEYDALRKQVWSQYVESDENKAFNRNLNDLAEAEIDRDSSLLSRDRGKAATLMQGAVDRSDIYKSVELPLDALIEKNLNHVLKVGRDIRKAEAGEDLAAEEERRGSKTDEEYAEEAAARRIVREQERLRVEEEIRVKAREAAREQERQEARQKARQQEEDRKRREEQLEKLRAEECAKRLELEKLRAVEEKKREEEARKEQEIAAIEKRKAIEREVQKHEAQLYKRRQLVQEKEVEKRELFQRRQKAILERERRRNCDEESARPRLEAAKTDRPNDIASRLQAIELIKSPPAPSMPPPVDEKALEEAALQLLLREGREMAAKSFSKPNFERNEPLDPPHQKIAPFSKVKLAESSPLKVSTPLEPPLRRPDLPPVPKLGYSAIKIRGPPNPNYPSHSYTELHGSQPRPTYKHNLSNRKSSRSRSRSKTRTPLHRPEEHRFPDEKELCGKRAQSFTALCEGDVDTYKFGPGRRSNETDEHEMLPQLDRNHRDYQTHHQHHLDRLKHDKLSRSRERLHQRSRSLGTNNGKIIEYEPSQGGKVHGFSVQSTVEAIDPYALDEGEINVREKKDDKRDRSREENYRSKRPAGDSQRKGEFREEMEWSDSGRGESYRGHGREEKYMKYKNREEKHPRHEGMEGKYSEHDSRGERYRRHKAGERKFTRHEGREETYPRHEEREDNYPKHGLREDNYPRHEDREERFREGGQDERYRREGGRDESRYRREGWREEKPRVIHVAPIDRYVPGGGELKRGKGREGVEDIDRYSQR